MKRFVALVACAIAVPAFAQDDDLDTMTYSHTELPSGAGAIVTAGGGVNGFTESGTADFTDTGGSWQVRAGYGTRSIIGGEIAYIGAAHGLENSNNTLINNGGEVDARLQYPIGFDGDRGMVEPFAVAGIGGQVYDVTDAGDSAFADNDLVGVVPLGLGIGGSYDQVYLDTRVTWRPTWDESGGIGADDDLSSVEWTANIGGEF